MKLDRKMPKIVIYDKEKDLVWCTKADKIMEELAKLHKGKSSDVR